MHQPASPYFSDNLLLSSKFLVRPSMRLNPVLNAATHTAYGHTAGALDYAISVEGRSLPPPLYQWQMLANVTVNQTSITTRSLYGELLQEYPSDIHYAILAARGVMVAREEVQVEVHQSGLMENSTWGLTMKP